MVLSNTQLELGVSMVLSNTSPKLGVSHANTCGKPLLAKLF